MPSRLLLLPRWRLVLIIAAALVALAALETALYNWDTITASYCSGSWAPPQRRFWHDLDMHPFPPCSMSTCFDADLCRGRPFKIYVYDHPASAYLDALSTSTWYTSDPSAACLFLAVQPPEGLPLWRQIVSLLLRRPSPASFRHLPHWNGGLNHVVASLADTWAESSPEPGSLGKASAAASCLERTTFRRGFDVSIPLPGLHHFRHLQGLAPNERAYFLTFRGTRYVGNKPGNFRSGAEFRGLHNGRDVVVATTCEHPTNNRIVRRCRSQAAGCEEDEAVFQRYTYEQLMNTTFGLAPAGRSPASFRLVEIMSAGAIPVVVADNYVEPLGGLIEWGKCGLLFGTHEIGRILPALRAMGQDEIRSRQRYCLWAYDRYLRDDFALVSALVASLVARFNASILRAPLTE